MNIMDRHPSAVAQLFIMHAATGDLSLFTCSIADSHLRQPMENYACWLPDAPWCDILVLDQQAGICGGGFHAQTHRHYY